MAQVTTSMIQDIKLVTDPSQSNYNYRPVVVYNANSDANIIFERQYIKMPVGLSQCLLNDPTNVTNFLKDTSSLVGGQTRPDWNWTNNQVIFNSGIYTDLSFNVYTSDVNGGNLTLVPGVSGAYYPTWMPDGESFVAENMKGSPQPCTTQFDLTGATLTPNMNGIWGDETMYGGMPAVNPADGSMIAFAGSPTCNGGYNQLQNYVFVGSSVPGGWVSYPVDQNATIAYSRNYQGRAPAWSPDGSMFVFESCRNNNYAIYMGFSKNWNIVQITDDKLYIAQHAKFFDNGTQLVLCFQDVKNNKGWQIGVIDLSSVLSDIRSLNSDASKTLRPRDVAPR